MALTTNGADVRRKVGALGNIVFEVSETALMTFRNLNYSAAGRSVQHELIGRKNIVEVTGRRAAEVNFEVTVSSYLGVNVREELNKFRELLAGGYAVPLVIGNEPIGDYRWIIQDYSVRAEYFGGDGRMLSATVNVRLLEYPRMEETML